MLRQVIRLILEDMAHAIPIDRHEVVRNKLLMLQDNLEAIAQLDPTMAHKMEHQMMLTFKLLSTDEEAFERMQPDLEKNYPGWVPEEFAHLLKMWEKTLE